MGLDMYLSAKKYISSWEHNGEESANYFNGILKAAGISPDTVDKGSPSGDLKFHVGYWRKANAIHNWFVQHVQGGEDECKPHNVSMEQLLTLKELCHRILKLKDTPKVKKLIEEELPPADGFFFGGTEVNEWYYRGLEHTIEVVEKCEKLFNKPVEKGSYHWDFEYQSSW